ncbi:bestrophin family ion channel [Massilia sp. YIM B02787]|uniref:Bestrophin family ion channel n=1 Tax=Massilia orientalis TaxID=3050128 RepID=A0ACC7MLT2_9BURK
MVRALALLLCFRPHRGVDRYWEGRKQWGELIHLSRDLARQCLTLIELGRQYACDVDDARAHMVRRAIGITFAYALGHQLRGSNAGPNVRP